MGMLHHLQCSQTPAAASSSEVKRRTNPSWPYCAPAFRKSAASHLKTTYSRAGAVKSPHQEKRAVWESYSAELVSVRMRSIIFFFSPRWCISPIMSKPCVFALWLTGFLVAHKTPRIFHVPFDLDCFLLVLKNNKTKKKKRVPLLKKSL